MHFYAIILYFYTIQKQAKKLGVEQLEQLEQCFYNKYKNSFFVNGCLKGLRPVVVGLIASAVISLGNGVFFPSGFEISALDFSFVCSILIFGLTVFLAFKKKSPILLILLSAGLGIVCGYAEKLIV